MPVAAAANGPVASGSPVNNPGATSGALRTATESSANERPAKSGSPEIQETSIVIGTVP